MKNVVAMSIRRNALLALVMMLTACSGGSTSASPPPFAAQPYGIEVIVRTYENFRTPSDIQTFVAHAAQNQVSFINVLVKQDEDGVIPSGQAYYTSSIAPVAAGFESFDVLKTMLDAAHARQIKVRAWIPQFHDQVAATRHPDWQMMAANGGGVAPYTGANAKSREYFVNPLLPQVQAYELSIIQEVTSRYAVDGVMLDWIRFDNYNMDLSDYTRNQYKALTQVDPLTLDFSRDSAALSQWNNYRTDGVAAYVRQVRQTLPKGMALGVYILPPEFVEVAQDAAKFNTQTDALAPMCYYQDWGYPIEWLWSNCMKTTAQKSGASQVIPAMDSRYTDAQYQQILTHLRADFPQIQTLSWLYHGTWDLARMQRIARLSAP